MTARGPLSRGAHLLLVSSVVAVFVGAVSIIGYFGWFVVTSVWGDDPDPPSVAFAAGVALCVIGGAVVAASSLTSVLCRLEVLRATGGRGALVRALRGSWTAGALCAMAGLFVLVGLGVVMTALSKLSPDGKAFVIAVFVLCALVPLAPGYEIWLRRAGAKGD